MTSPFFRKIRSGCSPLEAGISRALLRGLLWALLVSMVFVTLTGCDGRSGEAGTDTADPVCGKNLEQVVRAIGTGSDDEAAIKKLRTCPAEELVADLDRFRKNSAPKDALRVKTAFVLAMTGHETKQNRKLVADAVAPEPLYENYYADDALILVEILIKDGAVELLDHMFDAEEWSDGALAEGLSVLFLERSLADTEGFAGRLGSKTPGKRRQILERLCWNMRPDEKAGLVRKLEAAKKNSEIAIIRSGEFLEAVKSCQIEP